MGLNVQQPYTPGVQAREEPIKAVATNHDRAYLRYIPLLSTGCDVRRSMFSTLRSQSKADSYGRVT